MKKLVLIFGVMLVLLGIGSLGAKVFADRGATWPATCTSDDNRLFPHGMFCGSDPTLAGQATFGPDKSTVYSGDTVRFNGGYDAQGDAPGAVLVWATIDGPDLLVNDMTITNPGNPGGTSAVTTQGCPGDGAPDFGPVFNYRDTNPGDAATYAKDQAQGVVNGLNASPSAYNPDTNGGIEDCGSSGRMVYWKDAVESNSYGFDIHINNGRTGRFCVRENVSVRLDAGEDWFPKTNNSYPPHQQNVVASHIARQSDNNVCVQVNPAPVVQPATGTCAGVDVKDDDTHGGYSTQTYIYVDDGLAPIIPNTTYVNNGARYKKNYTPDNTFINLAINRHYHAPYSSLDAGYKSTHGITSKGQYDGDASKWPTYVDAGDPINGRYPCYSASCAITSVSGDGPSGVVLASGNMYITIHLVNDGPQPLPNPFPGGYGLGIIVNAGGSPSAYSSVGLNPGAGTDISFRMTAPASGAIRFDVAAGYIGHFYLNPSGGGTPQYCSGSASVSPPPPVCIPGCVGCDSSGCPAYYPFTISPSTVINNSGDVENPPNVQYTTSGTKTSSGGPAVPASARGWLTREAGNGSGSTKVDGYWDNSDNYGTAAYPHTYTLPAGSAHPGDRYCSHVTISPATGVISDAGTVVGGAPGSADSGNCLRVVNEPYVHIFGSDASAGGGFGDNCTTTPGGIDAYTRTTGITPVGSGVQIGALSINAANGFSSALLRGAAPTGSTGLTFSNTTNIGGGGAQAPALGGNLGGTNCVSDYFGKMSAALKSTPSTQNSISATQSNPGGSLTQVSKYYEPAGGTLTISGGTIDNGVNAVIYVKGNVVISNNITYANTTWGALDQVPSLYIISEGGNVYVAGGVTQLDGLYVSQPDAGGAGGSIYSCASGTTGYGTANTDLLATCGSQLVVNGSFVAQKVYLSRSFGSLRNSYPAERLKNVGQTCGDSGSTNNGDCAAEIFNFSPELYLAQPGVQPNSGPTTGKYDYVTSLAPVL